MPNPAPVPILDYRRKVVAALADAEWASDDAQAEVLRRELARVDVDIAAGERWEVPF